MKAWRILFGAALLCLALVGRGEALAPMPTEFRCTGGILRLGDSVDDALKFLGRPTVVAAGGENYCWRDRIDLYSPELIVKASAGKRRIFAVSTDRLPGIVTPEGIGIGSAKEAVVEQYGNAREYVDHNHETVMCYGGGTAKKKGKLIKRPYFHLRLDAKTQKVKFMVIADPMH